MRISDWSSDVCSSDLEQAATSTNRDGVRRRIARRVGAASPVPDGVETYALVRTQASKRFRGAGLGHLVAGAVVLVPVGEVLQFRLLQRTGTGLAAGGQVTPPWPSCCVCKTSGGSAGRIA